MKNRDKINFAGYGIPSVVDSYKPKNSDWRKISSLPKHLSIVQSVWLHKDGFLVISAVEKATDKDGGSPGLYYHLSFSRQTKKGTERATANQAAWILTEFGVEGAEEDNHVPGGRVRNFWRPVNENLIGLECVNVRKMSP